MIAHLSSEQLSECILGLPSPAVARHIEICPACNAELATLREALCEFRGAVRAWSGDQANAALAVPARVPEPRSWMASHQLALALLIAVICVFGSIAVSWRESQPPDHALSASDAALLNQVDAEVSRTVPAPMEPLMKLVVQTNAGAERQE
jgi:anti-sigma factor RsiW